MFVIQCAKSGKFVGFGSKRLVGEYPDARKFESERDAARFRDGMAGSAALFVVNQPWESMEDMPAEALRLYVVDAGRPLDLAHIAEWRHAVEHCRTLEERRRVIFEDAQNSLTGPEYDVFFDMLTPHDLAGL